MRRKKGLILGPSLTFASKAQATKHFSEMLSRYAPGDLVTPEDSEELALLLLLHTDADEKIGAGVSSFMVMRPDARLKGQCFGINRVDGTKTHFSYRHCITPFSQRGDVLRAARAAVANTVHVFKTKAFESGEPVLCALSGVPLTWDTAQVDHADPLFVEIVEKWRGPRAWEEIDVLDGPDVFGAHLADAEKQSFCEFHDKVATLRILEDKVNQADKRWTQNPWWR